MVGILHLLVDLNDAGGTKSDFNWLGKVPRFDGCAKFAAQWGSCRVPISKHRSRSVATPWPLVKDPSYIALGNSGVLTLLVVSQNVLRSFTLDIYIYRKFDVNRKL